jgi:uncharacterized protein YjdB
MLKKLLFTSVLFIAVSVQAFAKTGQTITFPQVPSKSVSAVPFALKAVAQSSLPVTYRVISGGAIASVTGDTVTLAGDSTGSVTIEASQAGNSVFSAAPNVYMTFTVTKNGNAVTLGTIPAQYVGISSPTTYTVSASAVSGTPTFNSSNTSVATIDPSTGIITVLAAGTTSIKASVAASSVYAAGSTTKLLTVYKNTNSVSLSSIPVKYVGASTFAVSAHATSGPIVYSSSNTAVATIDPTFGFVNVISAGSTVITASVAASSTYSAGQATQTLTVNKNTNTVTLAAIPTQPVTSPGYTVTAYSSSGSLTFASSNTSVATIDPASGAITVLAAGTSVISASVAATTSYSAGTATQTLTVIKNTNSVTLSSIPVQYVGIVTPTTYTVTAHATSGTPTFTSSNTSVATVNSITGVITVVGAGTASIIATVPATTTYLASSATRQLVVDKNKNTVTLATIPVQYVGGASYPVVASATNGTITYSSSNTSVATIDASGNITILAAGSSVITASVVASAAYNSGTASQSLTVDKRSQKITWGGSLGTELTTASPFIVTASSSSLLPTAVTVKSGPAVISAGRVILTGVAGTVVLSATQSGNSEYTSISSSYSIVVRSAGAIEEVGGPEVKYSHKALNTSNDNEDVEITVYPNPTRGIINVTASGTIETMSIYSITGQQVMKVDNQMASMPIDMSGLPKGVYFVRITLNGSDNQIVKRVVVE